MKWKEVGASKVYFASLIPRRHKPFAEAKHEQDQLDSLARSPEERAAARYPGYLMNAARASQPASARGKFLCRPARRFETKIPVRRRKARAVVT